MFEVHDKVVNTNGYVEFCKSYGGHPQCPQSLVDACEWCNVSTAENTCQRIGPTAFFLNDSDCYKARAQNDRDVQVAMSLPSYPDEFQDFQIKHIIGYPVFGDDGVLVSGLSFSMTFVIHNVQGGWRIAEDLENQLLDLREEWENDSHSYALEVFSARAFQKEFQRGLLGDIPYVGVSFVIMALFTMVAFCRFRRGKLDWVQSRSALGFGAICCVLLSIMSGYGLLFCIGVPFTAITQLLPFVMFGIGVDDAFIIMTAYGRTDPRKDPVTRVHDTIDEVGLSIFMTTATSVMAFGLGSLSAIPAVRWVCLYAFPMIAIDFVYQCTFFIALIVIDEKRVQGHRRDWLCCFTVPEAQEKGQDQVEDLDETEDQDRVENFPEAPVLETRENYQVRGLQGAIVPGPQVEDQAGDLHEAPHLYQEHYAERIMMAYAEILLKPWVRVIVLAVFAALFAVCAYSASLMTVAFDFTSVLPGDSYVIDFYDALNVYAQDASISPYVYFRFVDQSDPKVHKQMGNYVNDLVEEVGGISEQPLYFWLRDYQTFLQQNSDTFLLLPFNESLRTFLDTEEYSRYWDDIVLDSQGNILLSRVKIGLDNIDLTNVDDYLGAFRDIRKVGNEQTANQSGEWPFFTFEQIFYLWEFLNITTSELVNTTIYGVFAVAVMTLLIMPHPSATLFLTPMIIVLFVDLMGFLQICGVSVNGVSYIAVVMSIGLVSSATL